MKTYFVLSLYCEFENRNYYLGLPKQFKSAKKAIRFAKDTLNPITQFQMSEYLIDTEEMIETKNLEEWTSPKNDIDYDTTNLGI